MADTGHRREHADRPREDINGPAVVAYTTEDDRYRAVREAAEAHARGHGCVLVLFAADAAGFLSEPLPNALDAEGAEDRFGDRLGLADLEYLGRQAVATQVAEGRAAGTRVAAWLPKGHGMGAMAEYAVTLGAHIVFLPGQLPSRDELVTSLEGLKDSSGAAPSEIEVRLVGSPAGEL